MRAAFAYKQAGDYVAAVDVYERFARCYGNPETLRSLERNDPKQYAERLQFLAEGQRQLATTYFAAFRYAEARAVYEAMANERRFDDKTRAEARRNASILTKALSH